MREARLYEFSRTFKPHRVRTRGERVRELVFAPATGRHRLANAEIPDRSLGTATTHSGKRAVEHGENHTLLILLETDSVSQVMSTSATEE